jgi:hypothetical protein
MEFIDVVYDECDPTKLVQPKLHEFKMKRDFKGKSCFYCLIINKAGKTCNKRIDAANGNTSGISKHRKSVTR